MNLPVKFSVRAGQTYDATIAQLNARWGRKFVDEFEQKVTKTISLIAASPTLYPLADFGMDVHRCVLHKNCSMFYRVHTSHITILYFWDNRQEPLIF
jgi:hypothetical protein